MSDAYQRYEDGGRMHWDVARAAGASEELIAEHTHIKPGPRVMRVVLKGAA